MRKALITFYKPPIVTVEEQNFQPGDEFKITMF